MVRVRVQDKRSYPGRTLVQQYLSRSGIPKNIRHFMKRARKNERIRSSIRSVIRILACDPIIHSGRGKLFLSWIRQTLLSYCRFKGNEMKPYAGSFIEFPRKITSRNYWLHRQLTKGFYKNHLGEIEDVLDYVFGLATLHLFRGRMKLIGYANYWPLFNPEVREMYYNCQLFFLVANDDDNYAYVNTPATNDHDDN